MYEEELPRNRNKPRTLGDVCLGPTHNDQGGFKFMSLTIGAAVTRYGWDPIHMPSSVIERVNRLGKDQPELLLFTDRKGRLIGEAEPTGVDGAEQPGQDEDLEDDVVLDDKGAEDEEDLAKDASQVHELENWRHYNKIWIGSDSYSIVRDSKIQKTRQGPTGIAFIH